MRCPVLNAWRTASFALLLVLAGCSAKKTTSGSSGGSSAGGTHSAGGGATTSGGSANSGGASSNPGGGNPSGGNPSGGNPSGGNPSGGNPAGGNPGGAGGSNNGGHSSSNSGSSGGSGGSSAAACSADIPCSGGQDCVSGVCQCPNNGNLCGSVCLSSTDILTNPTHCGTSGCGVACPATATCVAGACQCPNGQAACGTACTDLQSDPKNCGKCGTTCPSGTCNAGACKKVKECFTKTVVATPLLADFEGYDGTTAATKWVWAFNAPAGSSNAVYAGLYEYDDGTGAPAVSIAGSGNNNSKYAATLATTSQASKWGGALGIWMGCIDASAYQGLSFWVKGSAPKGTGTLVLASEATDAPDPNDPAGGGTCTSGTCTAAQVDFPVSSAWSQVLLQWSTFTPGTANGTTVATTGNSITGLAWNVGLSFASAGGDAAYVGAPAQYNLSVDDIQFIGATACTGSLKLCDTGCVDTSTSMAHCGKCDNPCTGSRTCSSGSCVCPSGYTDCNGDCVDTKIDAQNCGGCGKACTGVCSAGSCQASTCAANMPQQGKTSTNGAFITLGKYWINNNQWGASGASGSQSIWSTCSSGNTIGWGTDWNWSGAANSVKSYASAVLGWQWGWKLTNTGLPVQLSAGKTITCGWTYRVQPGQTIDVSYDMFVHSQANPGTNDDPSDEIMIWLSSSGGAAPIGGTSATVNIGGTSWELHEGKNSRWPVHSYVRSSNADTGATLNISDFLKDLTTSRGLSGSKYLTSIQSGTEVFLGSGRLDTDQYYCTIQ